MISENERHYAEMVLGVIDVVECPMLMCEGEKAIVRKALKAYIESNDTADTPQTECRTCKWAEVSWTSHYCDDCKAHNKYEPNDTPQTDCQW